MQYFGRDPRTTHHMTPKDVRHTGDGRRWPLLAWALTGVVAGGVCASLLAIPVQTTDCLIPILQALDHRSAASVFLSSADAAAYMRPLRLAQIQALVNVADGHFFLVFKGLHVALVLACVGLFVAAAGVRTRRDAAALALGLAVLTGLHTFLGTVAEAYPVNHFLEIVVACLGVFVLAQRPGGWAIDLLATGVFVAAALTLESGVLVWVVIVVAWCTGMPGISRRGVVLASAGLAGYLGLRFGYFDTGLPTLVERSTGFGLRTLDPPELMARFGQHPWPLYVYNIISSLGSVTVSQPRAGVWTLPAALADGQPVLGTVINLVSSTATTAVIAWCGASRWRRWRTRRFEHVDQVLLVAGAVLVANAALSYSYTKDEIMSPAGAFYALAAVVAFHQLIGWWEQQAARVPRASAVTLLMLSLLLLPSASGWGLRAIGTHYRMHQMALDVRNEWVHVDGWLEQQHAAPGSAEARATVERLRRDALEHTTANPYFLALQGTVLFQ